MKSDLPIWVQYIQAFSLPALAVVAACIAYRQYRTAYDKLRFDLFERRLELYQTLVSLLGKALTQGTQADDKEVQDLYKAIPIVGFLFDANVSKLTLDIANAEMERRWAERRLESARTNREKHADESQRAFERMLEFREKLEPIFAPFLSFGKIKTNPFW